jgi:tRNA(fMet)-specific endonuclease VapC
MTGHRYLLDTNVISTLVREPGGVIFQRLRDALPASACTSIVVAAEIQYGLRKKSSLRLQTQVAAIMSVLDVYPIERPVEEHYADIRAHLERKGQPIGSNDLWIAAHARSLGMVLISDNEREFARVPGLTFENWSVRK